MGASINLPFGGTIIDPYSQSDGAVKSTATIPSTPPDRKLAICACCMQTPSDLLDTVVKSTHSANLQSVRE